MNSSQFEQTDRAATTGMVAALAATTMLFAAVASAYIVRRGISNDWVVLSLPAPVYLSILPGLAVSVVTEIARRKVSRQQLLFAVGLSLLFFYLMHAYAWRRIVHENSSPAAAFFFVIDGAFSLYTIGGIVALLASLRSLRLSTVALYWHYLNALWIILLALFHLWP
jgi:heme/copper-type cytochrome/quinol oxidase subunit 3